MVGRDKPVKRTTISDLARMFDKRKQGVPVDQVRDAPRTSFSPGSKAKSFTIAQGDERMSRLKSRADGIRYALSTENLTVRQGKQLRQTLHNLELAIKGMELTRKDGE
jgi:hypothetical protein